nr:hypothetical protein [Tanacetum cinerariifolium]
MQQKIERLQAQLGDLKGKSKDTSSVSDTRNPLSQKLENENVELDFQVLNYARENAHLKATYKNLFDSISVSRAQTKTIIASLQNELQSNIYQNAKLRTQLFKKVSDQKDNTKNMSENTKFAKQPIVENRPKIGETNALSKPVTSNSVSTPQESKGIDKTKTGRPQPRSNTKNDRVPSASKSSRSQNKEAEVEEHHRNLLLSKNNKHISSACKLAASSNSESQYDCSSGDNACTSNAMEPKIKRFPNSTSLLDRNDRVAGLPKFKYHKEHLCPSCEQGKSKRASHPPKPVPNSRQRLHLLYMDLCGPMRIASINGKWYVLVIVDDYSRYTWVHFLRSKDEAPKVIIKFLKRITVLLQSPVIIIRTDNGTEFKNQVLKEYFDTVGISHQISSVRTPQQNRVVERRNWTLVEAARTMLIFSRAPLFLWAEEIATACFTQNRSIIHRRFNKTPYELINGREPDISFLRVFGALCYPKNDHEDIGKLGAKGDIGFFIGYSADSYAYRVFNHRTKKIMETMNVTFDELSAIDFEQRSSKPGLQSMTSGHISSGLDLTYAPSTITTQQPSEGELDLLFESMYDDYIGGQPSATARTVPPAQEHQVRQTSTASTTIADTALISTNSSSLAINIPITSQDVDELNPNAMADGNTFVNSFANSSTSAATSSSHQNVDLSNMHTFYQPYPHEFQWTKDHPLEQVIGEPSRPVLTRNQLRSDGDMCMYALSVCTMEPKNVKEAMTDPTWIDSMQEELLQFKRPSYRERVPPRGRNQFRRIL